MTGADNQLITVRVRQVSADLGYINNDICRDIGKVSVYGRWSLIREVVEGRFYCTGVQQMWAAKQHIEVCFCLQKTFFQDITLETALTRNHA